MERRIADEAVLTASCCGEQLKKTTKERLTLIFLWQT
jgi:hypothetical protein